MSYEILKKMLGAAVFEHYQNGTPLVDIRAAIHAAGLEAEKLAVLELMEIIRASTTRDKEAGSE